MTVHAQVITTRGWFIGCDMPSCPETLDTVAGVALTSSHQDAVRLWEACEGLALQNGAAYCPSHAREVPIDMVVEDAVTKGEADLRHHRFASTVNRKAIRAPREVEA